MLNKRTSALKPESDEEDVELVATEQAGTRLRGEHCQIAARAHQEVEPARGQVRIGLLMAHRKTFHSYYSALCSAA
jgi:hypothetical protein